MRAGAARLVAALVAQGTPLKHAGEVALGEAAECGGSGGLIAIDAGGQVSWPFSTVAMPRGRLRPGHAPAVEIP